MIKVKIKNNGRETVKLISRHWQIFDSNGSHREVTGQGVVGEQPIIEPGDEFEYTSGTPLKTTSGLMQGSYQMKSFNQYSDQKNGFCIIMAKHRL